MFKVNPVLVSKNPCAEIPLTDLWKVDRLSASMSLRAMIGDHTDVQLTHYVDYLEKQRETQTKLSSVNVGSIHGRPDSSSSI